MEIKNVEEKKQEYPEESEIKQEIIEKRIPKKWVVLGLTAVTITIIGGFATHIINQNSYEIEGAAVETIVEQPIKVFNAKFSQYVGSQKGKSIKNLISNVMSSNAVSEKIVKINGKKDQADIYEIYNQIRDDKMYTAKMIYDSNGRVSEIIINEKNN